MASPSSSATTPSPALDHIIPGPMSDVTSNPDIDMDPVVDKEARKTAIQKFLARAELSKLTRALRARLSYASYKAVNNVSHVPLPTLETQIPSHTSLSTFSQANSGLAALGPLYSPAKRKASAIATNAISAAFHGSNNANANIHASQADGTLNAHSKRNINSSNAGSNAQSLYQSLLAPPPAKRARTIHNPEATPIIPSPPPVPPAKRGNGSVKKGKGKVDNEKTKSKAKTAGNTNKKDVASPRSRARTRPGRSNSHSTTGTRASIASLEGGLEDGSEMTAAAVLTKMLISQHGHAHGGGGGAPGSPPSTISASSGMSQQFMQSSTRTSVDVGAGNVPHNSLRVAFAPTTGSPRLSVPDSSTLAGQNRSTTPVNVPILSLTSHFSPSTHLRSPRSPPYSHSRSQSQGDSQPLTMSQSSTATATSAAVSDPEAADYLLELANSPARKSVRDQRNPEIAIGSGRVLFPTISNAAVSSATVSSVGSGTTLIRGGSQFSSFSSVGSIEDAEKVSNRKVEAGMFSREKDAPIDGKSVQATAIAPSRLLSPPGSQSVASQLPTQTLQTPSQLLPPPPSPSRSMMAHVATRESMRTPPNATASMPLTFTLVHQSPTPTAPHAQNPMQLQSPAPSPTRMNLIPASSSHLQIHAGPLTAPQTPSSAFNIGDYIHEVSPAPATLSLSKHVGVSRRLFEEQATHIHAQAASNTPPVLGSGIDLVKT